MRKFPGEEERIEEIRKTFAKHFDYCETIYRYWMESDHDRYAREAGLPTKVYYCVCALNLQAFRLYRSIVEECKRGEGFTASILCRSLFETIVALTFVLKPKVAIRLNLAKDSQKNQKYDKEGRPEANAKDITPVSKAKSADLLTREFRALLYLAHMFIERDEVAKKYARKRGLKKFHRGAKRGVDYAGIVQIEQEITPAWSHVLRKKKNYHGLQISDLARHLHPQLGKWYDTIYSVQSGDTHGASAFRRHIRKSPDGYVAEVLSDDNDVLAALKGATILFKGLMETMEEQIGYGVGNPSALKHFDRDYNRIFCGKKSIA